ncbi:Cabp7 [Symbiodinium natans]|uniref:Cabp7 protein n=1 Tax=Symbiodinium natans TaxID=878477 RepID=A0A812INB2_9DINO|nr:Cabp7 [Symbiodinium natans]
MATAARPRRRKSSARVLPANVSYVGGESSPTKPKAPEVASPGEDSVILSMKPGPVVGTYTITDIKAKFLALDRNGDGILSREEMGVLLRKGREDITDEELGVLWDDMNHDGDEGIDFDEFVDYLFGLYTSDGAKLDWRGASEVFFTVAGASNRDYITYHEYLALCRQLDLLDDTGFGITEAMALFKDCKESKRGLTFERFKLLVKKVSKKKNVPLRTVVNWIASFTPGRANEDVVDTWTACHKQ